MNDREKRWVRAVNLDRQLPSDPPGYIITLKHTGQISPGSTPAPD